MIIHSGIVTLDFDPDTEILVTEMPDVTHLAPPEVGFCLDVILDSIRGFHVGGLLLDASQSPEGAGDGANGDLARRFTEELGSTCVRKVARIGTADALGLQESTQPQTIARPFFRDFATRPEGMRWLLDQ
ncbi:hypothetical protein [Rufibacter aurantiacus]|uniref:hypothetical protein n=1 Tax=Rufibacter aurantiacus TaxID=2817374 RepID=UPI001B3070BD|nr:hypothetical protein [Rufibacter aurantiacus]